MAYAPVGVLDPADLDACLAAARALGTDRGFFDSSFSDDAATRAQLSGKIANLLLSGWDRISFVTLMPSRQINGHVDAALRLSLSRYHVPVLTNVSCWSYHDGAWQQLLPGVIYRMDPTREHGAVNWGASARVHLLVDC